jgi:hypothetical protein
MMVSLIRDACREETAASRPAGDAGMRAADTQE